MGVWEAIFAASYDRFMAVAERTGLARHRERLLSTASGRVLEIGGGTGVNLPYYGSTVSELVVSEPSEPMLRRLQRRTGRHPVPVRLLRSSAESVPAEAESFDCVVSTLVLCTVADQAKALAEVRRLLRPGGRLLFLEHVRSQDPALARWQDRLRRPWSWFGNGCQCNRPTVDSITAAGFSVTELRRDSLPKAPPIVRPLVIGTALRL